MRRGRAACRGGDSIAPRPRPSLRPGSATINQLLDVIIYRRPSLPAAAAATKFTPGWLTITHKAAATSAAADRARSRMAVLEFISDSKACGGFCRRTEELLLALRRNRFVGPLDHQLVKQSYKGGVTAPVRAAERAGAGASKGARRLELLITAAALVSGGGTQICVERGAWERRGAGLIKFIDLLGTRRHRARRRAPGHPAPPAQSPRTSRPRAAFAAPAFVRLQKYRSRNRCDGEELYN
ncbi:hypothetical protein EVAR_44139_1 [Eumeta japonica]|uniref:Uncharacterized protein n=1 Tax=Eumeta variegata TaxID=151549 RepID=A0A4C1XJG2_EUMVA|nr:hypothetical protein EVAR_44139_1 [Eumeta japonica]